MITGIAMLVIGLVIGGAAAALVLKAKIQAAADKAKGEGEVERASLNERLQARDDEVRTLNAALEKANTDKNRLQSEFTSESNKRATAEEKNTRIPALEIEVREKDTKLAGLNSEVTNLKEAQAELNTIVDKERTAAEEKLTLLNDAKQILGDAFKALSSDALKSNNQSFLELANAALEKFSAGCANRSHCPAESD